MGWWRQDEEGHSFVMSEQDPPMLWGDGPADIMEGALRKIVGEFEQHQERKPTAAEIKAGLLFSLDALDEDEGDDDDA